LEIRFGLIPGSHPRRRHQALRLHPLLSRPRPRRPLHPHRSLLPQGKESVAWTREILAGYDAVVIATHHQAFDLQELADTADLIIDTRNAMTGTQGPATVVKA
jgi:hypothetical protein